MYLFYFCYTAANDGQRRPTQVNEGQRRPTEGKTQVNEGPQRPTTANAGQRRSTKAHSSQRQPTTANAGQQRPTAANEGQRRPTQAHTFRPYVCFFFVFCSKLTILYKFYLAGCRPTQADKGPQQPMTANEGPQRQKGAQTTRLASFGPLYVFFQMYNLFVIFLLLALVPIHVFSLTSHGLSLSWAWAGPGPSTRARLNIIGSLSRIKPSLSRGFRAEPGPAHHYFVVIKK